MDGVAQLIATAGYDFIWLHDSPEGARRIRSGTELGTGWDPFVAAHLLDRRIPIGVTIGLAVAQLDLRHLAVTSRLIINLIESADHARRDT